MGGNKIIKSIFVLHNLCQSRRLAEEMANVINIKSRIAEMSVPTTLYSGFRNIVQVCFSIY